MIQIKYILRNIQMKKFKKNKNLIQWNNIFIKKNNLKSKKLILLVIKNMRNICNNFRIMIKLFINMFQGIS